MHVELDAGRRVGRYIVHRRIAAGGMATVHLGRLLGAAGFSRTVAIKRLHDGYARDPEFVAMLLDEARLASTIRHPNVVPTLDVVAEESELLVVMEYVHGDSLAHLTKLVEAEGGLIPTGIAASAVAHALHGLHAAHEARDKNGIPLGIVHRDVSPQNVLIGTDGVARVLDFGIAKAASRATSTEDGQLKGKTAYMAPEQLQNGHVDRRTDVFAAAIMLWELLAGRRLFAASSPAQTMANIISAPIDSPMRWVPNAPPELCMIALRGLERDPAARFSNAEEMAHAIEDAVALPRAKEIGAWVERVAAGTVSARAELVRSIERESNPMQASSDTDPELRRALEEAERRRHIADQPTSVGKPISSREMNASSWTPSPSARREGLVLGSPPTPSSALSAFGAHPPESSPAIIEELFTDLATVRSSANFRIAQPAKVSRASVVIAIAGVIAMLSAIAVVVFFVMRERGTPGPKTVASTTPPPSSDSAPIIEVSAAPPSASTSPPVASAATTATTPTSTTPTPRTLRPPTRGLTPKPPGAAPDCRVPYVLDDKGLKHFKPECI